MMMKKNLRKLFVIATFTIAASLTSIGQPPPPPDPPDPGGPGEPIPIGGTLSLGSGIVFLVSMAAAYGAKKIYDARRRLEE